MKRLALLFPLALLLSGCPPKQEPATTANATCVSECVQRNQMRAVSPEQIEADCKRECEQASPSK